MNKVYKSIISVATAVITTGATMTPAFVYAWGDSANGRASYTISQINDGALGDKITFNSISNSKIGDEKNFVGAKLSSEKADVWKADSINVKDGEKYTIRLYVHNNSPKGKEAIAKNVKASFSVPTDTRKEQTIIGYLDSSNATPNRYWDEVKLTSEEDFFLEYVENSAKWTNSKMGTVALPNDVIIGGATLGYDKLDGNIPGCFEYDGAVTIEVLVHSTATSKISKTVRKKGSQDKFVESIDAKIGDEVEFQIAYRNVSSSQVDNVMIRDFLPKNMEYVANSTYLYNSKNQDGALLKDNTVTTTGINIGSYKKDGNAYVRFTAKVVDKNLACGENQLVNWANVTVNSNVVKDDAMVMVVDDGAECKVVPSEPTIDEDPETIVSTGLGMGVAAGAVATGSVVTLLGYADEVEPRLDA